MRGIPSACQLHPDTWLSAFSQISASQCVATGSAAKCLIAALCSFGELEWRLLTDSICPVIASLMAFRRHNAFSMAPLAGRLSRILILMHLLTMLWPFRWWTETFAASAWPLWETGVTPISNWQRTGSVTGERTVHITFCFLSLEL